MVTIGYLRASKGARVDKGEGRRGRMSHYLGCWSRRCILQQKGRRGWCVPRRPRNFIRLTVSLFTLYAVYFVVDVLIARQIAFYYPPSPQFNYFLEAQEYGKMGYIVNTTECQILNMSAWDKSILPFISDPTPPTSTECLKNRQWTFVDEQQRLVLNASAVRESGYTLSSISCCYRPILRVEQDIHTFDDNADRKVIFSEECKEIKEEVTIVEDEFIRVLCKSKYWPWSLDIIYRYWHAIPTPQFSPGATAKIKFWSEKIAKKRKGKWGGVKERTPPNVFLIGIDSMSRLSFQRNMINTREYFREIGAVEMMGYTKLGENTFPNAVAFSMGYETDELETVCNYSMSKPLDDCPFIWKDFNKANYLTALIEDVPFLATFNYYKVGFVKRPVDFYFRPFMLGVHFHVPRMHYYTMDCIGRETVDETIHKYIENIQKILKRNKTPAFIYTWLTNLAHVDMNGPKFADEAYVKFLKNLDLEKSNTIMFFMSDHGYRYGLMRQTFAGWYEDKLPNLWVYIPPGVRKEFPQWEEALRVNSRRLSSPLDVHATLSEIVSTFGKGRKVSKSLPTKSGQSFFKEIDSKRRCKDAGISNNFCACVPPRRLELSDTNLKSAVESALGAINSLLPSRCSQLSLNNLIAGGIMDKTMDDGSKGATYIVAFDTKEGAFLFEASVDFYPELGKFTLEGDLLRMNKINTDVSCVKSDFLERYCYCKGRK